MKPLLFQHVKGLLTTACPLGAIAVILQHIRNDAGQIRVIVNDEYALLLHTAPFTGKSGESPCPMHPGIALRSAARSGHRNPPGTPRMRR